MLSVIIPTEGVEQPAVATLAALVPGAAAGVVREVLLVDRAGTGVIERVADVAGCRFLRFEGTRAAALAAGRPAGPLALADVPACRRGAGFRLDRGNRAIHRARLQQRQAARRHLPLRPLALFRHAPARRLQIRRTDDRRAVGGPGIADRAGSLRPARRLRAGCRAAPRPDCCGSSAARRARCCAAGSWWREGCNILDFVK